MYACFRVGAIIWHAAAHGGSRKEGYRSANTEDTFSKPVMTSKKPATDMKISLGKLL